MLAGLSGCDVSGLDADASRVDFARENSPNVNFLLGDAEGLPFSDQTFAAVTAMMSVHRFVHRSAALAECVRVLVPGGRVALVTSSPDQLARRPDFQVFPTALALEQARFPRVEVLAESLRTAGLAGVAAEEYREPVRTIDQQFVDWIRARPFFAMSLIPDSEFEAGCARLQERARSAARVEVLYDEYTIISGQKS